MRKQTLSAVDIAKLKLRVAENIIAQEDCYRTADVQSILAETKVGAWRKEALQKKLKILFSAA